MLHEVPWSFQLVSVDFREVLGGLMGVSKKPRGLIDATGVPGGPRGV